MAAAAPARNYFDPVVLDKIARLDLRARLVVEGFITGMHKSPYHGFAVEFATHREYVPGDEIKHIDWKVWSKTDRLYIKEYEEETNLRCTIILDCSKSMAYGGPGVAGSPGNMSKFDYGATAAACLAHLLQSQQDAVGLVTFNNRIEKNLPASTHPSHRKLLMHELQRTTPSAETDVSDVFPSLVQQIHRRGLVVLISDLFVDVPTFKKTLEQLRHRRHDLLVIHVMHDHELTFPFEDNSLFRGLENSSVELHTEPRALRKSYLEIVDKFVMDVRKLCAANGTDYLLASTKQPLDVVLAAYLHARQKFRRSGAKRK